MTLNETMNISEVWPLYLIALIFLIVGICMLCGKGANLIAGYNTLTDEEKAKYNSKILTRYIGSGLTLIGVTVLIFAIFGCIIPSWFSYLLPIEVVITIILSIIGALKARK